MKSKTAIFLTATLIAAILSSSAIAQKPKRWVEDNTIVSTTLPEIRIKVDADFKYIGEFDFTIRDVAAGTRFVFADVDQKKVSRVFIAQFEGFLPHIDNFYRYSFKNAMDFSGMKFRHNNWAYSNREARERNPKGEGVLTEDFLNRRGYKVEDELMMSRFLTLASKDKKHELILFYLENASSSGHRISEFYKDDKSTPLFKKIGTGLKARSLKSFSVEIP